MSDLFERIMQGLIVANAAGVGMELTSDNVYELICEITRLREELDSVKIYFDKWLDAERRAAKWSAELDKLLDEL